MFFELRFYPIYPGKMNEWLKQMKDVVIPYQASMGMDFVGSFISLDNPDEYIWIRRFENDEERKRIYRAMYENDVWIKEIAPKNEEMVDRENIRVIRMEAAPGSLIR